MGSGSTVISKKDKVGFSRTRFKSIVLLKLSIFHQTLRNSTVYMIIAKKFDGAKDKICSA